MAPTANPKRLASHKTFKRKSYTVLVPESEWCNGVHISQGNFKSRVEFSIKI